MPAQRQTAIEAPVLLDPRAVAPLVYLLRDPDPVMRASAARMLGRMPAQPPIDSRVEHTLVWTSQQATEAVEVRVAAIEALQSIGGPESAAALREIYTSTEQPEAVRAAARTVLAMRWPDELARPVQVKVDNSGRQGLIAGAALLGSYTLGAVGGLGRNDAGITIGVLGGAVTGGITAAYLTRNGEITNAQATWMTSAGIWGAAVGMGTAAAIQREPDRRFVLSLGLIGEGAAFGAAFVTRRGLRYSAQDVGEINGAGLVATDLALGGLLLAQPRDDKRMAFGVVTAAAAAGLLTGLELAPRLDLSVRDGTMITLAAYEGTVLGALAPTAWFDPSDRSRATGAGALLGAGLGIVGATALSQYTEIPQRDTSMMFLFGSYGKLLGYSIPLLTTTQATPYDQRGVFLGSIAGLAGGAVAASSLRDTGTGDASVVGLGTALGGWHGLGLGIAADTTDRKLGGWFTFGTSVGGLGSLALTRAVKLEPMHVQALAGGFFWGTWFSAWTAALENIDQAPALRLTVSAGDAGLAVGGLLVSPLMNIDPRRVGIAYLGGVSGAALGSLAVALATRDNDKVIGANLIGSGAGLAIGALVASRWKLAPRTPSSGPPGGSGLSLSAPLLTPLIMAPPPGSNAMPAIGIGATFLER
jgi:hypothetical protein